MVHTIEPSYIWSLRLWSHACELTKLPTLEAPSSWPANACRKPLSEAELLLPPSAVTSLSKLLCSDVSEELAVAPVTPVAPEVPDDVLDMAEPLDRD